jgi:RNA polymerase sigma-70 factor (ECF subfamily)
LSLSDYELIKLCLTGEDDAFAELIGRYKNNLARVIYNLIRNRDEVSDLLQEVFIKIYKSLRQYNPEYKFSAWSARIAVNLCLDQLRRQKPLPVSLENGPEFRDNSDTPEDVYLKKEAQRRLGQALDELPEKYRIPLILYHQNGLTYQEMVTVLELPLTIVKNRLYRARLMLREKLTAGKEVLP